jgi:hypothetical protein
MTNRPQRQIVLTHWNAGVFRSATLPNVLPELIIYSLLYDEVLIREEDLITNRWIMRLLSEASNFALFSELLVSGFVKLLRLPLGFYPAGRRFDPIRLPISARVEEHELRRTYKGSAWKPTQWEWAVFRSLDEIVGNHQSASRFHAPFPEDNPFAAQLADLLDNREAYRLKAYRAFRSLDDQTAEQFSAFCHDPEAWRRFLRERGVANPIIGPDAGFYRSAAYQCSSYLPTPRAILRLVESVYAATYCERESSDGRYGGSELVELPYRYSSDSARTAAAEEALQIEIAPTDVAATITLKPGIATVLERTRQSPEFKALRESLNALEGNPDSPLLQEQRFRDSWRNLCAVYSESSAMSLEPSKSQDHRIVRYSIYAYILARVFGFFILPTRHGLELEVAEDAATIAAIEKLGPKMLRGFRALVRIPALHKRMENAVAVRCSAVPLNVVDVNVP